ncbi:MAG: site-specific integrase [Hyphomicrobiales bacterium]|nr:site-specific integrase [Hyphomicrobiales bacterium]
MQPCPLAKTDGCALRVVGMAGLRTTRSCQCASRRDGAGGKAGLPYAKNGHARTIPLSPRAVELLSALDRSDDGRVFPLSAYAVRHAWERLTKRAGINDLHFHDLRHEAISRFFEKGLSVAEVALISGHRDFRQLFRYTHLRAEDVAKKL